MLFRQSECIYYFSLNVIETACLKWCSKYIVLFTGKKSHLFNALWNYPDFVYLNQNLALSSNMMDAVWGILLDRKLSATPRFQYKLFSRFFSLTWQYILIFYDKNKYFIFLHTLFVLTHFASSTLIIIHVFAFTNILSL